MRFAANRLRMAPRFAVIAAALTLLAAAPAFAQDMFDITVIHGINGKALGLDKALPVDVYVNGDLAIPNLQFRDRIETQLPAGNYTIMVKLAGTDTTVMSFGPADVPAGVQVTARARLGAGKTPTLDVRVR